MYFHTVAILIGVFFLGASLFQSRKIGRIVKGTMKGRWQVLDGFMAFFFVGYITHLILQSTDRFFPVEYVVSVVFLAGAVFVYLVMNISLLTIRKIRQDEQEIVRINQELEAAYESTVEGWGRALELRDNQTEGHTRRVSRMTVELGRQFNLAENELKYLKLGALLHDIGKMAVPDHILKKTGPLTEEEKKFMQHHPEFARDMLSRIEFLRPALDIPYCHHERWDGTGYPRGLKGEEIPFAARIFAVADVWDALVSDRRYHKGWDSELVCEHISNRSGTHFDPAVVEKFMELDLCGIYDDVFSDSR